jgi:hypothetical protein
MALWEGSLRSLKRGKKTSPVTIVSALSSLKTVITLRIKKEK